MRKLSHHHRANRKRLHRRLFQESLEPRWMLSGATGNCPLVVDNLIGANALTVPENSSFGTVIGSVPASDAEGDPLTFELADSFNRGNVFLSTFLVNPSNGEVYVAHPSELNFELESRFFLRIDVTEHPSGGTVRTSQSIVEVRVTDVNEAPIIAPIDDVKTGADTVDIVVDGTDPDAGQSFADAELSVVSIDSLSVTPVQQAIFDAKLEIENGNVYFDEFGGQEKWLRSTVNGRWYFVLPDSRIFLWDGSGANTLTGELIGEVAPSVYEDPNLITADTVAGPQARPQDIPVPAPATLPTFSVNGQVLTADSNGFIGLVQITMRATDVDGSGLVDEDTFELEFATINQPPILPPIGNRFSDGGSNEIVVDLGVTDPEGDSPLTFDVELIGPVPATTSVTDGVLTISRTSDFFRPFDVTVTVEDGRGGETMQTFQAQFLPLGAVPNVTLTVDNSEIAEAGGGATFTATLSSAADEDVTILLGLGGTATGDTDYTVSGTQIVIPQGSLSGSVAVTAIDDDVDELGETVTAEITDVTGANEVGDQTATTTIIDDELPSVTLAVDNAEIAELGGVATFTATLSAVTDTEVIVELGLTGTATGGTDYTASGTQIVIAQGSLSGSVTVTANDDDEGESDETVTAAITSVTGADEDGEQTATTTIIDDEVVENRLSIPQDVTASPNDTITVPVNISTVDLQPGGRLAGVGLAITYDTDILTPTEVTAGGFITGNSGWTLVTNLDVPGRIVVVSFTSTPVGGINSDVLANLHFTVNATAPEGPTSVNLVASSGSAFTEMLDENDNVLELTAPVTDDGDDLVDGVVTITHGPPTVSLSVDNAEIPEAGGVAIFTATLSAAADSEVTVDIGFGGTATNVTDYTASRAQIVIGAGNTTGTLIVTATDDDLDEGNETVVAEITNVTGGGGATEDGEQSATSTIVDDDAVLVALSVDNAEIAEAGGVATFSATLSKVADTEVIVELGLGGAATDGADYTASGTQIVIAQGSLTGSVTVTANDDDVDESDETVTAAITAVTGADEDGEQTATTTIIDDDITVIPENRLSIPQDLATAPSDTIIVPVSIETVDLQPGGRLAGVGLAITYDTDILTPTEVTAGGFITGNSGWTLVTNLDVPGRIVVVSFTSSPVGGINSDVLVNLIFTVNATAPPGPTSVNLVTSSGGAFTEMLDENDNVLELTGPVTDNGDDPVDGVVTVAPGPPTVSLSVDNAEIAEAGGVATFTATLSEALETAVTVDLGFGGTATSAADYAASGAQIVIAAGSTSGSVTVTAIDDALEEGAETVLVEITTVTGGANESGDQQATTTIIDDEEPPPPPVNRLSMPQDLIAAPNGTISVPVTIETADLQPGGRLAGVGLAVIYDVNVLTAQSVTAGSFITGNSGWTLVTNIDFPGRIVVIGFTSSPVSGVNSELFANLDFMVNADAPAGPTSVNLVISSGGAFTEMLDENDNVLELGGGPLTDGDSDPIDGVITIGALRIAPFGSVLIEAEGGGNVSLEVGLVSNVDHYFSVEDELILAELDDRLASNDVAGIDEAFEGLLDGAVDQLDGLTDFLDLS